MILSAARNSEITDLDRSAELGDLLERHRAATNARQRGDGRHARRGGPAEPRADGKIAVELNASVVDLEASRRGGGDGKICSVIYRNVGRVDTSNARATRDRDSCVPGDGDVAHKAA